MVPPPDQVPPQKNIRPETMTSQTKLKIVHSTKPRTRCCATSAGGIRPRPANNPQTTAVMPAPPAPLDDLLRQAAATAQRSRSESTEQTYKNSLRTFARFAAEQGKPAFPASAHTVAAFLQRRIEIGISPPSLTVALTAIRNAHHAGKQPDPTDDPNVRAIFHGYRRIRAAQGKVPQQTRGMSEADLTAIIAAVGMSNDIYAVRDVAIISVLREGLLRPSECIALRVRDFSRELDGSGHLQITRSKTDQEGRGTTLFLGEKAAYAVANWMSKAPADSDAPLFRRIHCVGRVQSYGLSRNTVSVIVRKRGEAAGIFGLSGHSGRVGMAQSLIAFGAGIAEVAIAGRWKSPQQVIHYASRQEAERSAVAKYHQNRV